jgi:hypothetical protein
VSTCGRLVLVHCLVVDHESAFGDHFCLAGEIPCCKLKGSPD